MKYQMSIAPNNAIYINGYRVAGRKPFGLFDPRIIQLTSRDLAEIVQRCNELLDKEVADDEQI